jgi:Fe-S cluster biogenesis protein NfuA
MHGSDDETLARDVAAKLDARIRPLLQVHGGDLTLLTVSNGVVNVRFEGACVGCPLRPVTMASTIGPALRTIDGVDSVRAEGVRVSQASAARLAALETAGRNAVIGGRPIRMLRHRSE